MFLASRQLTHNRPLISRYSIVDIVGGYSVGNRALRTALFAVDSQLFALFFKEINLHRQLPDFALELFRFLLDVLVLPGVFLFKDFRKALHHVLLPSAHHDRMYFELLGNLTDRLDPFDRLQGNPGLELPLCVFVVCRFINSS